jgi:hypothetical protein
MYSTRRLSRRLAAGSAVLLTAGIVACGSSGGSGGGTPAAGAAVASSAAASAHSATTTAICGDVLKIDSIESPDSGPNDTPPVADVKAYGEAVTPAIDDIVARAPAELTAPAATAKKVFETMRTTGDDSGSNDPAFEKAGNVVEAWVHDHCGYQKVDVTAVDFAFQGLPATLKAGPTSLAMTNKSTHGESHVLLIARGKNGAALTVDQVEKTPAEQLFGMIDVLPGGAFAAPGETGGGTWDLKPGHYVVLCPIGDPPHFMKGMVTELTVA